MLRRPWFAHDARDGGVAVRIPVLNRWVLRGALEHFRSRLAGGGADLERLFPPAYIDHPGLEDEYQRFMHEELLTSRLAAVDLLRDTIDTKHLSAEQAQAWLQAVNALRLMVGTSLGIDHDGWTPDDLDITDDDDPRLAELQLYGVLQGLLYGLLGAITPEGFHDPDPEVLGFDPYDDDDFDDDDFDDEPEDDDPEDDDPED